MPVSRFPSRDPRERFRFDPNHSGFFCRSRQRIQGSTPARARRISGGAPCGHGRFQINRNRPRSSREKPAPEGRLRVAPSLPGPAAPLGARCFARGQGLFVSPAARGYIVASPGVQGARARSERGAVWLAHHTGGVGVGGSNPLAPTNLFNDIGEEQGANTAPTPHLTANLTATSRTNPVQSRRTASIFDAASVCNSGITWL